VKKGFDFFPFAPAGAEGFLSGHDFPTGQKMNPYLSKEFLRDLCVSVVKQCPLVLCLCRAVISVSVVSLDLTTRS